MSAPWQDRLIAFDLETTGVDVLSDRVVAATVVMVEAGLRPKSKSWIVDPGIPIPDEAAAIHGVTTEQAQAEGQSPETALFEILATLAPPMAGGTPLVAFNAAYDLTLLEAECQRHGVDGLRARFDGTGFPVGPVIDPFVIDKAMDPYRKGKRTLTAQAEHYGVTLAGAHSSAQDALAAARLVPVMVSRFDDLHGLSAGQMHMRQIEWRRQQQRSLADYFDRKGTEHDGCDGGWPFQSTLAPVEAVSA